MRSRHDGDAPAGSAVGRWRVGRGAGHAARSCAGLSDETGAGDRHHRARRAGRHHRAARRQGSPAVSVDEDDPHAHAPRHVKLGLGHVVEAAARDRPPPEALAKVELDKDRRVRGTRSDIDADAGASRVNVDLLDGDEQAPDLAHVGAGGRAIVAGARRADADVPCPATAGGGARDGREARA